MLYYSIPLDGVQQGSSEKGEVLLGGIGTLRYLFTLSENSACQVPICAVAAWGSCRATFRAGEIHINISNLNQGEPLV